MKPFQTILFPTDFSEATAALAPYVNEVAERFNARVVVLHVFDLVSNRIYTSRGETIGESGEIPIPYTPEFEEMRRERQQRLQEFARAQFPNARQTASIEDGDPATVIEAVAQSENADLIALSTRGLGKFRRLLVGSVAAKVLHDVTVPVLTSAHEPRPELAPGQRYNSILCAVDVNEEADDVLNAANFLAQSYGAKLCLLHIASAPVMEGRPAPTPEAMWQAFDRALHSDASHRPAEVKIRILGDGVPAGIRDTALKEQADLVVVGRGRERGNLSRVWSELYTIIRESPCPVLSV